MLNVQKNTTKLDAADVVDADSDSDVYFSSGHISGIPTHYYLQEKEEEDIKPSKLARDWIISVLMHMINSTDYADDMFYSTNLEGKLVDSSAIC